MASVNWDLGSSAQDLIRALAAVSEGFCPDCLVPLGESGRCPGCESGWGTGRALTGEQWLEYRSWSRCLSVTWYPFVIAEWFS